VEDDGQVVRGVSSTSTSGIRSPTGRRTCSRWTACRIVKAIVDVSGEPFIDLEKEAVALMARE
jgi:hypothetical protein